MKNDKWFLGVVGAFVVALLSNLISIESIPESRRIPCFCTPP